MQRLLDPVSIAFNQTILLAVFGLLVNGVSVFILGAVHKHNRGANIHAAAIAIVSRDPRFPNFYKRLLNERMHFNHITIEVHDYKDMEG